MIDCYYKIITKGEKPKLHFAKFSGEYLIFASEDERDDDGTLLYPNGYFRRSGEIQLLRRHLNIAESVPEMRLPRV